MVVREVISLLAERVRNGAAARVALDYLHSECYGWVCVVLSEVFMGLVLRLFVATRKYIAPILITCQCTPHDSQVANVLNHSSHFISISTL